MEKADISTLEKPDISILVLQSDLSFGYLSAELKSPVKIPIPLAPAREPFFFARSPGNKKKYVLIRGN
jgi:hypothetical protein